MRVVTVNVLDANVVAQRFGRVLRPKTDGGRAILYELVTEETAEERVAERRR